MVFGNLVKTLFLLFLFSAISGLNPLHRLQAPIDELVNKSLFESHLWSLFNLFMLSHLKYLVFTSEDKDLTGLHWLVNPSMFKGLTPGQNTVLVCVTVDPKSL